MSIDFVWSRLGPYIWRFHSVSPTLKVKEGMQNCILISLNVA